MPKGICPIEEEDEPQYCVMTEPVCIFNVKKSIAKYYFIILLLYYYIIILVHTYIMLVYNF